MADHGGMRIGKEGSNETAPRGAGAAALNVLLAPVRLLKRVFFSELRLKRRGGKLTLVLDDGSAPAGAAKPSAAEAQPRNPDEELRQALKGLLDQHAQTRKVMKHLVVFEAALHRMSAAKAMQDAPFELLSGALDQLEGLLEEKPAEALALLRNKMMLAVIEREKKEVAINASARPSDFNVDDRLEVEEVPGSVFSTQVFRDLNATLEQIRDKK